MMTLPAACGVEATWSHFTRRLAPIGPVVVAGGAVRDALMGRAPKDIDVFVLGTTADAATSARVTDALTDLPRVDAPEWHRSEPFLQATVRWLDFDVQVMLSPAPTVEALLDTFDWNVSLFAYDGTVIARTPIADIAEGKPLTLQTVTFPLATLRRGFRFSERFKMQMPAATVKRLCWQVIEPKHGGTDAAPAV